MFQPHRFNSQLKAVPNAAHQEKVKNNLVHGHTHEELKAADLNVTAVVTAPKTEKKKGKAEAAQEPGVTLEVQATSSVLSRVHETTEGVAEVEMTPPHPPREETPEYNRAHHHLVKVLDSPCAMCGVRNSTLNDPKENPFGAKDLETHHYPIERSLLDACDPKKIGLVFPEVTDKASLDAFVDSERNLMVLCDIHHRHPLHGIHHLTPQDFFVQPFLLEGYQVVSDAEHAAAIEAADEALIEKKQKSQK